MNQEQMIALFEIIDVETDSLASQSVTYDESEQTLTFSNTDVYGETAVLRVYRQHPDGYRQELLEVENVDEFEFLGTLGELLEEVGGDADTFYARLQADYTTSD